MNKNKTTFKILLESSNTASYTASLMPPPFVITLNPYNATYNIDLKTVISNDEDYDKSYYVYATFRSRSDWRNSNGITLQEVYLLNIDFNKSSNTIQYQPRANKNICYILPVYDSVERGVLANNTIDVYFYLKDTDQMPSVVHNLRNVNEIKLQVLKSSNYTQFVPTSVPFSFYACILTFVEV